MAQKFELPESERRQIAWETARLNPVAWKLHPWDGQGKSGCVRLLGVSAEGREILIYRKSVRTFAESEKWFWAINFYISKRSDWLHLQEVHGANEEEALTF